MLSILAFAVAYAVKGGQFKVHSGHLLAAALIFAFCLQWGWIYALKVTIAWMIGVYASMGEEAGAIGRWGHGWGEYLKWKPDKVDFKLFGRVLFTYIDGRSYGIKKALQRGCWAGSCFALATENIYCIPIITFGFVFGHFIGQEIYYRIHKRDDWKYSEPIIGSFIGLCCDPNLREVISCYI